MKTIWKFAVKVKERWFLELPRDYQILKVARGHVWISGSFREMHDDKNRGLSLNVAFATVGTGRDVPEGFCYVGTYFEPIYVWHVYVHTSREG